MVEPPIIRKYVINIFSHIGGDLKLVVAPFSNLFKRQAPENFIHVPDVINNR